MRTTLLLLVLSLSSCGWVEGEREEAAEAAREATVAEVQRILSEAIRRADRGAGSAERILRPLPLMTPGEELYQLPPSRNPSSGTAGAPRR